MDHNINGADGGMGGPFSAALSVFSAVIAVITLRDVQVLFSIGASGVAMLSGYFAIRYYIKKDKS